MPWGQDERLEYSIYEKVGGKQIGGAVFKIKSTERGGELFWKIQLETLFDQPSITVVEVDQERFLPVYSYYRSDVLGEIEAEYQGEGVSVQRRLNSQVKRLQQDESTYDLYQSCYLMRLFPIQKGFQKKVFITNSKRPIEQSPATLQVVDIETLKTRRGAKVQCYRVDALIDEIRSSFWISADERRLLYRVVDDSGVSLELIPPEVRPEGNQFLSEQYGYCFEMPENWLAFVQEKRKGPEREQVAVMSDGLSVELTLTRHRRVSDFETIGKGSLQWLLKNRRQFELIPELKETIHVGDTEGQWFCGKFIEGDDWKYLFHAVVVSGDNLFILTGIAGESSFKAALPDMSKMARSIRSAHSR